MEYISDSYLGGKVTKAVESVDFLIWLRETAIKLFGFIDGDPKGVLLGICDKVRTDAALSSEMVAFADFLGVTDMKRAHENVPPFMSDINVDFESIDVDGIVALVHQELENCGVLNESTEISSLITRMYEDQQFAEAIRLTLLFIRLEIQNNWSFFTILTLADRAKS